MMFYTGIFIPPIDTTPLRVGDITNRGIIKEVRAYGDVVVNEQTIFRHYGKDVQVINKKVYNQYEHTIHRIELRNLLNL